MSTKTTRELVRMHAWELIKEGIWPTPTLIQSRIGAKGSKTTIVDELRRWTETSLQILVVAKHNIDYPSPDTIGQVEAKVSSLESRLEESRDQLKQAFDRFETFENRMFMEVDKARHEHVPKLEKAKKEMADLVLDRELSDRRYLTQLRTLSARLAAAGLDPDY